MEIENIKKLDPNRIEEKPKNLEDFICKICTFIINDPHECETCGIPYCKDCLQKWKFISNQCPMKCNPPMKIKPAHRFIKKMLGELKIKCENEECPVVIELCRLDYHLKECEYLIVRCPNGECEEKITKRELEKHKETCKFKTLQCERCSEKFRDIPKQNLEINEESDISSVDLVNLQTHDCIKSLSNNLKCLTEKFELLFKKNEKNEKQIKELSNKTNLLSSNFSYKCGSGHNITFTATWESTCATCNRSDICTRWECTECESNYCGNCIRIINPVFCPNLHTFLIGGNVEFQCDLCCLEKVGGNSSIHDNVCDFDVCEGCVEVLFPNIK